jgi:hypothetical protein
LHFDRAAADRAGFAAVRVTLTRPDGSEDARVVAIGEPQRRELDRLLDQAIRQAAAVASSPEQAREALLALLAEKSFVMDSVTVSPRRHTVGVAAEQKEATSDG